MSELRILLSLLFFLPLSADGEENGFPVGSCSSESKQVEVGERLASASTYANYWKKEGSVSFETEGLFQKAEDQYPEISKPEGICPEQCGASTPLFLFESIPNKRKESYEEYEKCAALLKDTEQDPIVYERRTFATRDEAIEWYQDLTRGKGDDGEDLYDRCDGSCSPAYETIATKEGESVVVSSRIVCGHARDKSDNQYLLRASFVWVCGDPHP